MYILKTPFYPYLGLELNQKFPISQYLTEADILPGGLYRTEEIIDAVKNNIQVHFLRGPQLKYNKYKYLDSKTRKINACNDVDVKLQIQYFQSKKSFVFLLLFKKC